MEDLSQEFSKKESPGSLLPCPFCGGLEFYAGGLAFAVIYRAVVELGGEFRTVCRICKAIGPIAEKNGGIGWNARELK